jgi:hypothetical protein
VTATPFDHEGKQLLRFCYFDAAESGSAPVLKGDFLLGGVQPADASEPLGLQFELTALPSGGSGGSLMGRRTSLGGTRGKVELLLARAPSVDTRDKWVGAVKAFLDMGGADRALR